MPRAEKPLELDGSALSTFAVDLRKLRAAAGSPSYRELAQRAYFSATTLSDAASGRRLPSLAVTLAYVRACGGDPSEWEHRWRSVVAELNAAAPGDDTDGCAAPYIGLRAYDTEDADHFFGREQLVDTLLSRIATHRFAAVIGPSGSGKTSVLRAGLTPKLTGIIITFTPGTHPLQACARQLATLGDHSAGAAQCGPEVTPEDLHQQIENLITSHPAADEAVVIVDQFEDLFTMCRHDHERSRFIAMLVTAASAAAGNIRVVLGIRADFEARSAEYPELAEILQHTRVAVDPMTIDELRQAVTRPAIRARCTIETPLLTAVIVSTHGQAGSLPWLSQALLETWRHRSGNNLTLAAFQASGELDGLQARAAEEVFAALDDHEQDVARDLFQRLTEPGEGMAGTARTVNLDELDDTPAVTDVVEKFVRARLLVRDARVLELAHNALIGVWPRLTAWLGDDREGQRIHRELTNAVATWRRHGRDPSLLLRGTQLTIIRDWARERGNPNAQERSYLDASAADRDRETEPQVTRHRRGIVMVLVALLIIPALVLVRGPTKPCSLPLDIAAAGKHSDEPHLAAAKIGQILERKPISANPSEAHAAPDIPAKTCCTRKR
ncbi:helix-turn-helix domain-containing protein [Amycolatopsis sp. NPDC051128]|uniref:nSTAND1 domain-containing NTPase n=1 Tax=Amycolatopsis sp. NPDC051128 TaxID=3155412 RepID=UPI00341C9E36